MSQPIKRNTPPAWTKPITHDDLIKEGKDDTITPEQEQLDTTPLPNKTTQGPVESYVPKIRIPCSDDIIIIKSKKRRKVKVDRTSGHILAKEKVKKTVFEQISTFNPKTLPSDRDLVYLSYVGYWTIHKQYIRPKKKLKPTTPP